MKHRTKKDIFGMRGDIATIILCLVISLVFVILMSIALGFVITAEYEDPEHLIYEECTFIEGKLIRQHRGSRYYEIRVEEYEEPLKIFSVSLKAADRSRLASIDAGEKITVSLGKGSDNYSVLAISCGDDSILTYDEYLEAHHNNDVLGLIALPIMIVFGLILLVKSIYELCIYCKAPKVIVRVMEKKKQKKQKKHK
jgi:hypothetical protein